MDRTIDLLDSAAKKHPLKALCDDIGKAESTLRNELTQQPGYKLGLKTSILILRKTGDLSALDRIEAIFGRVAFRLPKPEHHKISPVMTLVGKLTKEFGEHMEELANALSDGDVSENEAKNCLKELKDVIEACVELQAYLEQFTKKADK